ncbi:MAG: hypothetical protein JWO86_6651 [Myxococcaceae bacterium]|nr:hypothetical protein [Myxococcaceae bacterium]
MLAGGSLLGLAVAINHGRWADAAFAAVVPAFVIVAWRFGVAVRDRGVARANTAKAGKTPSVAPYLVLALLAALPIIALCDGTIIPKPAVTHWLVGRAAQVMFLALLGTYLPFLSGRRAESERLKTARFAGFALLVCVAGFEVIRVSPVPDIDVWTVQKAGAEALLDGKNPYVVVAVPDTDPETDFTVPYCYPPFPIYMGSIALAARGDVRHPLLVALLVAGFAMRFIARRRKRDASPSVPSLLEDAPALFFWLAPPLFMVLDRSWIDPFQIVLITLGVAAFVGGRKTLAAVLLGVAISSKQSMFFVFPLAAIVLGFDLRRCIVMGIAALVPVLPFLAWDFRRLKYANFDFMNGLGARHDGLCFSTWVYNTFHATFPPQITFVAAAAVVAAACLRRPLVTEMRSRYAALGFARALVATYFVFFFFNRWAFANYYFLLIGFASLAAATAVQTLRSSDEATAA